MSSLVGTPTTAAADLSEQLRRTSLPAQRTRIPQSTEACRHVQTYTADPYDNGGYAVSVHRRPHSTAVDRG